MASFECPYCSSLMAIDAGTYVEQFAAFTGRHHNSYEYGRITPTESCISIEFYKCPNCEQYTIKATGLGDDVKDVHVPIRPISSAKQFPKYIPEPIRQDYEEACAIVNLSPKASATLSRRCLQGMIRDFWGIKRDRLIDEIADLQGKIPASQWAAIDALRKIGNIGAHMEKDVNTIIHVDPGEAERLIMLIELLIDKWYIARHEETVLLERIVADADSKRR